MTDNSSTPDTQAPASKTSPSTRLLLREKDNPLSTGTAKEPFWKTVPVGMVKGRDRTGGTKYSQRAGRPTAAEIAHGKPVGTNWNLLFVRDGQRTCRTYDVTYTSPIDPTKSFRIRIAASSLRGLFRQVVYAVGNLRATPTTENFSMHFMAVSEQEGMTEEIIDVAYAEELPLEQKPTTDELVEPITVED